MISLQMPREGLQTPTDQQAHERFADFLHQSLNHNIALADRTASIACSLATATIIFASRHVQPALQGQNGLLPQVVWFCILLALLGAAASAFGVVAPRIHRHRNGPLFWSSIAKSATAAAYAESLAAKSGSMLEAAKLEHCYALAQICRAKFRLLRLSMVMSGSGLGGFIVASVAAGFP